MAGLPSAIQSLVWKKLDLFLHNAAHPSLRVKKMRGHPRIWELSVSANYRITFEWSQSAVGDRVAILRRVGTHDLLKHP